MVSSLSPVPSATPAKSTDPLAGHKGEGSAPAAGATFEALLARKTTHPAAQTGAPASARAPAHPHRPTQAAPAEPAPGAAGAPSAPEAAETPAPAVAHDDAETPVGPKGNRPLANPGGGKAAPMCLGPTGSPEVEANACLVVDENPDVAATTASPGPAGDEEPPAEEPQGETPARPMTAELPPAVGLPTPPPAPLAFGLPTALVPATPQAAEPTEVPEATEAVAALGMSQGNLPAATRPARFAAATATPAPQALTAAPAAPAPTAAFKTPAAGTFGRTTGVTPATPYPKTGFEAPATPALPAPHAPAVPAPHAGVPLPAAGLSEADGAQATATPLETTTSLATATAREGVPGLASTDARQGASAYGVAAQIAAGANRTTLAGSDLGDFKIKNIKQAGNSEGIKNLEGGDGIRLAYDLPSMPTPAPVFQPPTASVQVLGPVDASSPVAPSVASTAVRMVEKVSEVADHLAAHPADQVTVRIDLDAVHRVDVHVSMRGGQVHADFRSDSPGMREALATAWNDFAQKRDGTDQSWAAPVFAPLVAPVAAPSFSANQQSSEGSTSFGPGQDSGNRQSAERAAQDQPSGNPTRGAARPTASATAEAKTPPVRFENSQHLSVLA